jgi:hypothetical protein
MRKARKIRSYPVIDCIRPLSSKMLNMLLRFPAWISTARPCHWISASWTFLSHVEETHRLGILAGGFAARNAHLAQT